MSNKKEKVTRTEECILGHLDACGVDELVGKILTIIDASVSEGRKCESLKSLLKQEIWGWAVKPQLVATQEQIDKWAKEAEGAPYGSENPLQTYTFPKNGTVN